MKTFPEVEAQIEKYHTSERYVYGWVDPRSLRATPHWWRPWMRHVVWLIAFLFAFSASAQAPPGCADLSWQPPTQNTDGTPLTNLAGYKAYAGPAAGTYNQSVTYNNPGLTNARVCMQPPGMRYFVVTAFNTNNVESSFSNVASKMIVGLPPNPPTVPQPVTIAGPFYTLLITADSIVMLEIGTVVAGRPCDPTQQVAFNGTTYMRVNTALVTPFPGQSVEAAWARCQ